MVLATNLALEQAEENDFCTQGASHSFQRTHWAQGGKALVANRRHARTPVPTAGKVQISVPILIFEQSQISVR